MTLSCLVCHLELESAVPVYIDSDANQPYKATTFIAYGQYGSTAWDPMDNSYLEINICDDCLIEAGRQRQVLVNHAKSIIPNEYWPAKIWE